MALWHHGYWGIITPHFQSFGAGQVFTDLVIALTLAMIWIVADANYSQIDAAYWHEWEMFHLREGIQPHNVINLALFAAILGSVEPILNR